MEWGGQVKKSARNGGCNSVVIRAMIPHMTREKASRPAEAHPTKPSLREMHAEMENTWRQRESGRIERRSDHLGVEQLGESQQWWGGLPPPPPEDEQFEFVDFCPKVYETAPRSCLTIKSMSF